MNEATEELQIYDPLATLRRGGTSVDHRCTDRKEFDLWRGRWIDSSYVSEPVAIVLNECPNLFLPGLVKGRLS